MSFPDEKILNIFFSVERLYRENETTPVSVLSQRKSWLWRTDGTRCGVWCTRKYRPLSEVEHVWKQRNGSGMRNDEQTWRTADAAADRGDVGTRVIRECGGTGATVWERLLGVWRLSYGIWAVACLNAVRAIPGSNTGVSTVVCLDAAHHRPHCSANVDRLGFLFSQRWCNVM